jgi:hypothetical protein
MGFPFRFLNVIAANRSRGHVVFAMKEPLLTVAAIACRDHAASHPQQQATAAAHWSTFFRSTE